MDDIRALQIEILKKVFIADLVVAGIFALVTDHYIGMIYGLLFGTAIGVLNFLQLANTLTRAVKMHPNKASGFTTSRYMIRYIIVAVVLIVAVKSPQIEILGALVGLVLIKFVVLFTNLFNDKKYFKNIFRRREG